MELREAHIKAIQASAIVNRLNKQALGEIEMGQKDIQAAQILLRKVLPDLKVSEITATVHLTEPIQWVGNDPSAEPSPDKV